MTCRLATRCPGALRHAVVPPQHGVRVVKRVWVVWCCDLRGVFCEFVFCGLTAADAKRWMGHGSKWTDDWRVFPSHEEEVGQGAHGFFVKSGDVGSRRSCDRQAYRAWEDHLHRRRSLRDDRLLQHPPPPCRVFDLGVVHEGCAPYERLRNLQTFGIQSSRWWRHVPLICKSCTVQRWPSNLVLWQRSKRLCHAWLSSRNSLECTCCEPAEEHLKLERQKGVRALVFQRRLSVPSSTWMKSENGSKRSSTSRATKSIQRSTVPSLQPLSTECCSGLRWMERLRHSHVRDALLSIPSHPQLD